MPMNFKVMGQKSGGLHEVFYIKFRLSKLDVTHFLAI